MTLSTSRKPMLIFFCPMWYLCCLPGLTLEAWKYRMTCTFGLENNYIILDVRNDYFVSDLKRQAIRHFYNVFPSLVFVSSIFWNSVFRALHAFCIFVIHWGVSLTQKMFAWKAWNRVYNPVALFTKNGFTVQFKHWFAV